MLRVLGRHAGDTRSIYLALYKIWGARPKSRREAHTARGTGAKGKLGLYIKPHTKHRAHESSQGVSHWPDALPCSPLVRTASPQEN